MLSFLMTSANLPFTIALALMVMIATVEAAGALIGVSVSAILDSLYFELDVDIDTPATQRGSSNWLGWLHIGKVPVLILLVLFLTFFGLTGLLVQGLSQYFLSWYFPPIIAIVPALIFTVFCVRFSGEIIANLMPEDETEAVNTSSFVGRVAVITLGTARHNSPAQAKLSDQYGQTHYVMVEPDDPEDVFSSDTPVLLVKQDAASFRVIKNTFEELIEN